MNSPKNPRAYGLFEQVNGRWVRLYPNVYGEKTMMIRVCQSALLAPYFGQAKYRRELRPVGSLCEMRCAHLDVYG